MYVVAAHEGANESIARLNAAIEEWTAATDDPDDHVESRPRQVRPLPDVDYGTVEGCDEALRAVDRRLGLLSEVQDGAAVEDARDEALAACRALREAIGEHRGRLAVLDDDDDD